jgi:hypothetical protein
MFLTKNTLIVQCYEILAHDFQHNLPQFYIKIQIGRVVQYIFSTFKVY